MMQNTHDTKRDHDVAVPARKARGELPFEYEDRSDGRYDRALEEVKAAWLWIQSRRAQGLPPN
jgi:hypothetical protein